MDVAIVLMNNGVCHFTCIDSKSASMINIFARWLLGFIYLLPPLWCFNVGAAAYLNPLKSKKVGVGFAFIGFIWRVLCGWRKSVVKIEFQFMPYLAIAEGIFTAWIPSWLILIGYWH